LAWTAAMGRGAAGASVIGEGEERSMRGHEMNKVQRGIIAPSSSFFSICWEGWADQPMSHEKF